MQSLPSSKDYRVLNAGDRMNRLVPKPLPVQKAYLECSDGNETFRRGKVGAPESVQTIFITYYAHGEEIFASLYFLIV